MGRTCWTSQMVYLINLQHDRLSHIMYDQLESWMMHPMFHILTLTGKEIIKYCVLFVVLLVMKEQYVGLEKYMLNVAVNRNIDQRKYKPPTNNLMSLHHKFVSQMRPNESGTTRN